MTKTNQEYLEIYAEKWENEVVKSKKENKKTISSPKKRLLKR